METESNHNVAPSASHLNQSVTTDMTQIGEIKKMKN